MPSPYRPPLRIVAAGRSFELARINACSYTPQLTLGRLRVCGSAHYLVKAPYYQEAAGSEPRRYALAPTSRLISLGAAQDLILLDLTNEVVGRVECRSASGVDRREGGGDLANRARGITIFAVPYDSGHRTLRMGAGPEHFLSNGMEAALAATGREVRSEVLEVTSPFRAEVATAFELFGMLAKRVQEATTSGRFPLVLSGNCNSSVGVIAGLAGASPKEEVGLIWFDGHADFNTPETTTSGSLDGMGLAMAVGHCWGQMVHAVPAFRPVSEENVVLIGSRGATQVEKERLWASEATVVQEQSVRALGARGALGIALNSKAGRTRRIHVHLDLDVLDPEAVNPANEFAPERGLSAEEVEACIWAIREHFEVTSTTVASYDPSFDGEGHVLEAGIALVRALTV
jgi:arginase